jgi:Lipase maturation factor
VSGSDEDQELRGFTDRPWISRWLADGSSFVLTRYVLLRLLGFVYFTAFLVALLQGRALLGEHGLLPMRGFLHLVARASGGAFAGFLRAPSVFWLASGDGALVVVGALGAALSLAVMAGVTNAGVMLILWVLQFSLVSVGQIFWSYGWEIQLLETGMLAAFLCPLRTFRPFAGTGAPPIAVVWLFRWLIVRVMLGAGLIKLRGDPCWRELTCLVTHYETQPNPSPLSWVLHQLPPSAHTVGVLFNHVVELGAPWLVLGPRPARRIAGALFVVFQGVLIASGNLSFLNWLTLVPALACFDDALLLRAVPRAYRERVARVVSDVAARPPSVAHRRTVAAYAVLVGILSFGPVMNLLSSHQAMNTSFDPLRLVNTYGAFGSVNRYRDELVIEGTADDIRDPAVTPRWEEYELPCKPGDPNRRPCLVSPYHYRLDWQMWFAAMESPDGGTPDWEPWLAELVSQLLHGDKSSAALLAKDPFPDPARPPQYVRIQLYRYQFTRHAWWKRRLLTTADRPLGATYMRPMAADDPELAEFLRTYRLR